MDMQVYIVNTVKYNEGETVGVWLKPPIDIEVLKERLFLDNENSDYLILNYDLPFCVDEHVEIEELNRLCVLAEKLEGTPVEYEIAAIEQYFFSGFEDLVDHVGDIKHYPCDNMEEVARYLILETNECGEIPIALRDYIDYKKYGRDLELNSSNFLVTSHGVFEYTGK